jgi:hypothetical protein
MDTDTSGLISQLENERAELRDRQLDLSNKLRVTEQRLALLTNVLQGLLELNRPESDALLSADNMPATGDIELPAADSSSSLPDATPTRYSLPSGTRVRSTDMVAQIIRESDRALTRQEIQSAFKERFGYPPSWKAPANALNNAIARAHEKGLIVENDGYFSHPQTEKNSSVYPTSEEN